MTNAITLIIEQKKNCHNIFSTIRVDNSDDQKYFYFDVGVRLSVGLKTKIHPRVVGGCYLHKLNVLM